MAEHDRWKRFPKDWHRAKKLFSDLAFLHLELKFFWLEEHIEDLDH